MEINNFLEQRIKKVSLMVGATAKKIVRKEFKKMKRDLIKGMLKKS